MSDFGNVGTKKYEFIADHFRRKVVKEYRPDDMIAGDAALAAQFGVSVTTVRKAMETLVAEGIIERRQGVGTFVAGAEGPSGAGARTRTKTILILLLAENLVFFDALDAMQREISALGHGAMIRILPYYLRLVTPPASADPIRDVLRTCTADGIICGPVYGNYEVIESALADARRPVVVFRNNRPVQENYVAVNAAAGAYEALQHLVRIGCRRVRYFGRTLLDDPWARPAGLKQFLADSWPDGAMEDLIVPASPTVKSGYEEASRLFRQNRMPDGIVTCNDVCAIGVLMAAQKCGVRVPEDLALVAFDNYAATCEAVPPLTLLQLPGKRAAIEAARIMNEMLNSGKRVAKRQVLLEPRLVMRESSAGFKPRRGRSAKGEIRGPKPDLQLEHY